MRDRNEELAPERLYECILALDARIRDVERTSGALPAPMVNLSESQAAYVATASDSWVKCDCPVVEDKDSESYAWVIQHRDDCSNRVEQSPRPEWLPTDAVDQLDALGVEGWSVVHDVIVQWYNENKGGLRRAQNAEFMFKHAAGRAEQLAMDFELAIQRIRSLEAERDKVINERDEANALATRLDQVRRHWHDRAEAVEAKVARAEEFIQQILADHYDSDAEAKHAVRMREILQGEQ